MKGFGDAAFEHVVRSSSLGLRGFCKILVHDHAPQFSNLHLALQHFFIILVSECVKEFSKLSKLWNNLNCEVLGGAVVLVAMAWHSRDGTLQWATLS